MITINTLENVSIAEITRVFNDSFADYFIKFNLTEQNVLDKIQAENIELESSVGVFDDDKIVGFILFGIAEINGKMISYNAGTGVIPTNRGNHFTEKMYEFILPILESKNIQNHQLEVIDLNEKAIAIYTKIGYKTVRKLLCFKGLIDIKSFNNVVEIKEINNFDTAVLETFWNENPSWQNSFKAVNNAKENHKFVAAYVQNELVGYLIYATNNNRIKQFAVKKEYRNRGVATELFQYLQNIEITLLNVSERDLETITFLEKIGLKNNISQFEMTKNN